MKRRTWLLVIGLLLIGLAFVIIDQFFIFRPGVTEANVKRLREGMTLGEVERLFGPDGRGPPGLVWEIPEDCGLRQCSAVEISRGGDS